jgi:hypothetical protein
MYYNLNDLIDEGRVEESVVISMIDSGTIALRAIGNACFTDAAGYAKLQPYMKERV